MANWNVLALALLALLVGPMSTGMASAQNVKRHLHCRLADGVEFGVLITFSTGKTVVAINNSNRTIPKGTKFTYRIDNSSRATTFTSTQDLRPGAEMPVGSTRGGASCGVTVPG